MSKRKTVYLGDGAYADFDGWALTVWCERGDGKHFVVFEPSVWRSLVDFAAAADENYRHAPSPSVGTRLLAEGSAYRK
jgi:hypothetical protein